MKLPKLTLAAACCFTIVGGLSARAQTFYIPDASNSSVYQITSAGAVSTFAYVPSSSPNGVAVDASGNVYVADFGVDQISVINPSGNVSTFANLPGGTGPIGLVFDSLGNLYAAGLGNGTIQKITPAGAVSTFATLPGRGYGLTIDGLGNLYTDFYDASGNIDEISPSGSVSLFANTGGGSGPFGLAVDQAGNVYAALQNTSQIDKITRLGSVTTFATLAGNPGPEGLAFDASGNIYTSTGSGKLLEITPDGQTTTTIASGLNGVELLAISPVPEPSSAAMLSLVAGFLALRGCYRFTRLGRVAKNSA